MIFIHRNLCFGEFSRMKHPDSKLQNLDETPGFGGDFVDETPGHSCS